MQLVVVEKTDDLAVWIKIFVLRFSFGKPKDLPKEKDWLWNTRALGFLHH